MTNYHSFHGYKSFKDIIMPSQLKRSLLIGLMVYISVFAVSSFAKQQSSMLEQFDLAENWPQKQLLASELLSSVQLSDKQKNAIYSEMAKNAFEISDYTQALHYYKLLEQGSDFNDLPELHFRAVKMQGVVLYYQGLMQQAVIDYSRALSLAVRLNSPLKQANLLSNIGLSYFDMYNMELALDYYQQAKVIYEQDGSAQDQADILHNIAGVYIRLSRYDSALEIYRKVLSVFQALGDEDGVAQVHGNMGVAYDESGQNQLALHYYQLALRYYQSTNNAFQLSTRHNNLANINLKINELDAAYYHSNAAQGYARQIDNKQLLLAALHVLAKIQLVKGDIDAAKKNLEQSIALAKQYKDEMRLRDGLGIEALLSASLGDFGRAMHLHDKFVEYQRSMTSEEIIKALNVFQSQFESNKLNQEIQDLKQTSRLQELEIAKRSQLTILLAIVFVLVLICSVALYRRTIERKAKVQLEEKVEKRTQELRSVAQKLQSANEVKSQFLANISHEIRTPLTAILGQTDDLLNGLYDTEQLGTELLVIKKHSDHLKELINDVLDLSKIEANRLELSVCDFDLVQLVMDVYSMSSLQARSKGLTLTLDNQIGEQYWVKLDLMRVKQILINLLSNAVKFTQQGSVTLRINETALGVQFAVIDTGIGIQAEQLKIVFECFQQGDNTISRRFGGSGLGLSLSQQLAMMMGGYINAQSEYGKGSEFMLYLPCKQYLPGIPVSSLPVTTTAKTLAGKVLLAEDHPDNRRLITRFLNTLGLDVIAVSNGEEAVEQCLSEFPDVVLLDIQMPIMDGLTAFDLLEKCGFNKPVFALTANAMSHEIADYLALGFSGYLSKPLDKEDFYTKLSEHLSVLPASKEMAIDIDVSDLIRSFVASFDDEVNALKDHYQQGDLSALQQDSHRILGAAQMFALDSVIQPALLLDKALLNSTEAENNTGLTELVESLIHELEQFKV